MRRAQTAFRLRKEQHVAALEEKCGELGTIIEEMSNTFMQLSDKLLESGAVHASTLRPTIERFLQLSQRASHEAGETVDEYSESIGLVHNTTGSSMSVEEKDTGPSQAVPTQGSASLGHTQCPTEIATDDLQDVPIAIPKASGSGGTSNLNPLLDYRLWGIHKQPSSTDGTSALPYILAGRDSFASRLYFETIVLAVQALQGARSRTISNSIFRYKMRHANSKHILAKLTGVLNVMLHGTSQDPNRPQKDYLIQGTSEDEQATKVAIMRVIASEGSVESDYLSSWEVERYLQDKWSFNIDSGAVRVHPLGPESSSHFHPRENLHNSLSYAPTMIPGLWGHEQTILDVKPLVEALSRVTVSIGEGPRWHFTQIDLMVQSLLTENMKSQ